MDFTESMMRAIRPDLSDCIDAYIIAEKAKQERLAREREEQQIAAYREAIETDPSLFYTYGL